MKKIGWLAALAALGLTVLQAQAQLIEIEDVGYTRVYSTAQDGAGNALTVNSLVVGTKSNQSGWDMHAGFVFQMTGASAAADLKFADFSISLTGGQGTPLYNVDVYANRVSTTNTFLASDFEVGTKIMDDFVTTSDFGDNRNYSLDSTGQAELLGYLTNNWVENDYVFITLKANTDDATPTPFVMGEDANANYIFGGNNTADPSTTDTLLTVSTNTVAPPPPPPTVWELDMNTDPVLTNWTVRSSYSNYTLNAGVMTMDNRTSLDTDPFNELKGVTKVDLVWRSITEGTDSNGRGAFLWLSLDSDDGPDYYPIHFDSILTNDSQTVQIIGGNTTPVLASHEGFGTNMLTLSATLDAFNETADYIVTDGTLSVTNSVTLSASAGSGNYAATLGTIGPSAEVDYVRVEATARPDEAVLVAKDAIAMELLSSDTITTGSVELAYGTVSNDMEITSIAVSDESHSNSFSVVTVAPATLDSAAYGTTNLVVEFDNGVAGLSVGTATGLVTVTWTETGSGVTNDTVVPVSATVTPAPDQANSWNGAGNGVNWGDADNWVLDRVPGALGADRAIIQNGSSATVATNFTGAFTYEVNVRTEATLNIAADLKNVDDMRVGSLVDRGATVNQTAGDVTSATLDISVAGNASNVVYTLTDGSHDTDGALTIQANGVLNVDGGSVVAGFSLANNQNSLVIGSGGVLEISGGIVNFDERIGLNAAGIYRIVGDEATITHKQFASGVNGTFEFILDETGVSTLETTSWAKLAACTFAIDGSAYTNGPADILLFSAGSISGISALGTNYNVTGFGDEGVGWTITEVTTNVPHTVTLNILGNVEIGDITMGGVNEDGDIVFSWDTADGQAYNVETNINLVIGSWGIYETIIGDGSPYIIHEHAGWTSAVL